MRTSLSRSGVASARLALEKAIRDCVEWLQADLETKTEGYYLRVLSKGVRDLYNGKIDEGALIDTMIRLTEEQFGRAWREGARDVDFDPANMTDEDLAVLQARIDQEQNYILDFVQAVIDARKQGIPVDGLLARVELWAGRYNEVRDQARIYFGDRMHLVWRRGPTEEGCRTCTKLDGIVAEARKWNELRDRGIYPQSGDLECSGFNCLCTIEPTDDPLSPGGIPSV